MKVTVDSILAEVTSNPLDRFTWDEWKGILETSGIEIKDDASENKGTTGIFNGRDFLLMLKEECICELRADAPALDSELDDATAAEHDAEAEKRRSVESDRRRLVAEIISDTAEKLDTHIEALKVEAKKLDTHIETLKVEFKNQGPTIVPARPKRMIPTEEWRKLFNEAKASPPLGIEVGTSDGSPLRIDIECVHGRAPYLSTWIYLSNVVGTEITWFGAKENDDYIVGWKVILLPRSRNTAMSKFDMTARYGLVESIRVIKLSENGEVLLGEVSVF